MTRVLIIEPGYCPYQAAFDSPQAAISEVEDGCTIRGRFLVCGLSESKMLGLSKEQAERYNRLLFFPQVEDMLSGDLPVAKVRPLDERFGSKISFWERLSR